MRLFISSVAALEKCFDCNITVECDDAYVEGFDYDNAYFSSRDGDYFYSEYTEEEWNALIDENGWGHDGEAAYISEEVFDELKCVTLSHAPEGWRTNYTDTWQGYAQIDVDETDMENLGFEKEWIIPEGFSK